MRRGEFKRGDGLILPNNISIVGAQMVLEAAFQHAALTLYAALVQCSPTPNMTSLNMIEPTIGTNGYVRINIPNSSVGWPLVTSVGNEACITSETLTWTPTGSGFNQPVQRIAILGTSTYHSTDAIFALSEAFTLITMLPSTPLQNRQFTYTFYI